MFYNPQKSNWINIYNLNIQIKLSIHKQRREQN